ncbi:hypothetical protein acdb102_47710 [Acidothermaceae bacterium B102]|nr:hypothetical protein acdb102_47710 [Acidothermaceae bacterium B102]
MRLFRQKADRPPRAHVAGIEPNPLRTPDDAYEPGLLIGLTGDVWTGIAAKNLKDRAIATGSADAAPAVGTVGKVAGRRAGTQP